MLVGLATLIILLFGGGTETFLLNPQMEKNVKTYVADKGRKKEIYSIINQTAKDQNAFLKKRKNIYTKQLLKLNDNYASTKDQFSKLYYAYHLERVALQNKYLDNEIEIRSLILEPEWNNIMNSMMQTLEKGKAEKAFVKRNDEVYEDLTEACEKSITDTANLRQAILLLMAHKQETVDFMNHFLNLGYRNIETIRKWNANRTDFEPIRKEMSDKHYNYLSSVVDLYFNLKQLSTEENWKTLKKEFAELFKEGKNMI